MKTFFVTSTVTIEAESKEEADKRLITEKQDTCGLGFDLLDNAQIDEDIQHG